jgi:hypothetical protein
MSDNNTAATSKIEKAIRKLQRDRIVVFRINALTRIGREELMNIFVRIFDEFQLNPAMLFNLYSAVVEIIFNAIKANAKHVIFKSEVRMKLLQQQFDDIDSLLEIIFHEEMLRDFMTRHIIPEKLKKRVNTVLQLTEKKRTGRAASLTTKDIQQLMEFNKLLEEEEVFIHFTMAMTDEKIVFNVVNDIPILSKDMERILQSRRVCIASSMMRAGQPTISAPTSLTSLNPRVLASLWQTRSIMKWHSTRSNFSRFQHQMARRAR